MTERTFTLALTLTVKIDGEQTCTDAQLVEQIVDGLYAAMPGVLYDGDDYILFMRETVISPPLV